VSVVPASEEARELAARATWFTVGDLFRRSVQIYGERVAVVSSEVELTYAELDDRVNRLASVLAAAGLARGDRIAVLSTTRPEYIEVYFAAAKLGLTLVGLNIRMQLDELVHCLESRRRADQRIRAWSSRGIRRARLGRGRA
jgi:acyl-CoA synthetase (AMP-forming)/AMP-acid ligase II